MPILFKAYKQENKTPPHNKFYNVWVGEDGTLILNWGRIGTSGQWKVEKHTPDEATNMAMRQVYAKASKGYVLGEINGIEFPMEEYTITTLHTFGYGHNHLETSLRAHIQSDAFRREQRIATSHYDKFISETQAILDAAAAGREITDLLENWANLADAWKELDDKHNHALAAVRLVQQTVQQKLMTG